MASAEEIRTANVRYHDAAAASYDAKWSIGFDGAGQRRMVGKLAKAIGRSRPPRFRKALEIGAGTGYFSLNLLRAGLVEELVATDISPGMLEELQATAARHELAVRTLTCEAASLPFDDASFDLVLGHAVLHHLPDLEAAFAEFRRVLAPGGTLVFCGEPSRHGHRLARLPKRVGLIIAPVWRALLRAPRRRHDDVQAGEDWGLEALVDVHSFSPGELSRLAAAAGFEEVRVSGEELTANWFGWVARTLESTAPTGELPFAWYLFALRGYLALEALDRRLLEPHLPPAAFYNLLLCARAPSAASAAERPLAAAAAR
jgi:ubiquinone/menaquinone biosynthesis C-methylase UbiE